MSGYSGIAEGRHHGVADEGVHGLPGLRMPRIGRLADTDDGRVHGLAPHKATCRHARPLSRASIFLRKRMDCRIKSGNDEIPTI
jgi:hypothetical protein